MGDGQMDYISLINERPATKEGNNMLHQCRNSQNKHFTS